MDFVERHLGFAPDGGDGSMEILVLVAIVAIVVMGALWLATRK
jgi:heme/copper-type cytochrome/quinol oxidase subunit 4